MVAPRTRVGLGVASMVLWCLAFANWVEPVVRLSVDVLNPLAGFVLMLLPWPSLIWLAQHRAAGWRQAVPHGLAMTACAAAALVSMPLALGAAFATYDVAFAGGEEMKPIGRLAVGDSDVVLYRRNGGATTSYAVEARQEEEIAPGVLRVGEMTTVEAHDAEVEPLGGDRVRLTFAGGSRVLRLPFR